MFINDVKELSISGEFSDGAYGFYNYSQGSVLYSAIQAKIDTNIAPVANAGVDQNITVGGDVVLDGSESTDDVNIVSYIWKEAQNILGYEEILTLDSVELGTHTFTLFVEDDEGLRDSDEVIVIVNDL